MASKESEAQGAKQSGIKGKFASFKNYMYNPVNKTILERSCMSWAKIGLFYLVYYACLAGFWAAMLFAFFTTIDEKEPRLQDQQSLIKYNPGMGFRPQPDVEYTLIEFSQGEEPTFKDYKENLDKFLAAYSPENQTKAGLIDCNPDDPNYEYRDPDLACKYPLINLGDECTKEKNYGYDVGRPCVLLKMNKLFNWQPEALGNDSVPNSLQGRNKPGFVGVTCEGKTHTDIDNIGPVEFYPAGGFDASYFPYKNQKGYLPPVVMAQFTRVRPGTLVIVLCKVWGANIYHDNNDRAGSVQFEIQMD